MLGRMALFVFMLLSLLPLPARSQDIFDAAKWGNLEKVRALVATDPDLVTAADSDGHTALAWARPFIYLPFAQEFNSWVTVLATTRGDPAAMARALHRLLRTTYPDVIVTKSTTLAEHIGIMHVARRLSALLSSVCAGLALFLAAVGLLGVVSFAVARRTREMGIRMALGSEPRGVVTLMVREGMRLVLLGAGVGLAGAILISRGLSRFLFGVSALDPLTLSAGILVLLVTGALAAYIPARRASQADPVKALRAE
jgi:predicted lysophospholipase L1 biosynthesis ABC-type transport system permease subunit